MSTVWAVHPENRGRTAFIYFGGENNEKSWNNNGKR